MNPHEQGTDTDAQDESDDKFLHLVHPEGLCRGLVEPIALLDMHRVIPGKGDGQEGCHRRKQEHGEHLHEDGFREKARKGCIDIAGHQHQLHDKGYRGGKDPETGFLRVIRPPFAIGLLVIDVRDVRRNGIFRRPHVNDGQQGVVKINDDQNGNRHCLKIDRLHISSARAVRFSLPQNFVFVLYRMNHPFAKLTHDTGILFLTVQVLGRVRINIDQTVSDL